MLKRFVSQWFAKEPEPVAGPDPLVVAMDRTVVALERLNAKMDAVLVAVRQNKPAPVPKAVEGSEDGSILPFPMHLVKRSN